MKKILIIVALIILSIFLVNFTKALYTSNSIWDYYLNSKGFYFESDYNKNIGVYNFWDGSEVEFNISNAKEGKYTEDDIEYEASCIASNDTICKINGNDIYKSTIKGGSIRSERLYLDIESLKDDIEVQLVIKSIFPYKKTIKNKILLHKDSNIVGSYDYEFINYENYSLLNISNYYSEDKCFNVKWNVGDIKVSTSNINVLGTDSNGYVNEFAKNVSKNETVSIKFYNQSDMIYDKNIFELSECSLES